MSWVLALWFEGDGIRLAREVAVLSGIAALGRHLTWQSAREIAVLGRHLTGGESPRKARSGRRAGRRAAGRDLGFKRG